MINKKISMIKKVFIKLSLFWKIYFILFFLCSIGGIIIPWDKDIIWIWVMFFYFPFSFCLVYPYGFIMGIYVQSKLSDTEYEILSLSIIFFVLIFILLTISYLDVIFTNGILYVIEFRIQPALGSTVLFIVGAFIVKSKQRK